MENASNSWRKANLAVAVAVALASLLAGCGGHAPWGEGKSAREQQGLIFTPNGEPLIWAARQGPACEEALGKWMGRVDSNKDGVIDRAEFMADADAQFARMDTDHDNFITADELSALRLPYLKEPAPPKLRLSEPSRLDQRRNGRPVVQPRGEHTMPADMADPVMSADTNLDFKVSRAEFAALNRDTFEKLDVAHDGRITRAAVLKACHPHS